MLEQNVLDLVLVFRFVRNACSLLRIVTFLVTYLIFPSSHNELTSAFARAVERLLALCVLGVEIFDERILTMSCKSPVKAH